MVRSGGIRLSRRLANVGVAIYALFVIAYCFAQWRVADARLMRSVGVDVRERVVQMLARVEDPPCQCRVRQLLLEI